MKRIETVEKYFNLTGMNEKYNIFLSALLNTAEKYSLESLTKDDIEKEANAVLNLAWMLFKCSELEKQYELCGIEHGIFLDTISDIRIWTDTYFDYSGGDFGLTETGWLINHISFNLFRLGRLQFAFGEAERDCSEDGLCKGEPIIEVHIPEGAPLTPEACADSFKAAKEFFADHFPNYKYRFFTCHSWLLDRNLEKLMKSGSNILKFARLFNIIDSEESYAGVRYIFKWNDNKETILKNDYPEGTLKYRMKEYIASGGILCESYGIIKV